MNDENNYPDSSYVCISNQDCVKFDKQDCPSNFGSCCYSCVSNSCEWGIRDIGEVGVEPWYEKGADPINWPWLYR